MYCSNVSKQVLGSYHNRVLTPSSFEPMRADKLVEAPTQSATGCFSAPRGAALCRLVDVAPLGAPSLSVTDCLGGPRGAALCSRSTSHVSKLLISDRLTQSSERCCSLIGATPNADSCSLLECQQLSPGVPAIV